MLPQAMSSKFAQTAGGILFVLLTHLMLPTHLGAQDTITLSPTSGTVGTDVTISGKSFGCRFVSIYWDDQILDPRVPIKNDGELNYKFKVPPSTRGKHITTIRELGVSSNTDLASMVFVVAPHVKIFPDIGTASIPLTVTGSGFAAFEKDIKIFWNNKILVSTTKANQLGSWGVTFEIPDTTKGEHFITISGSTTTAQEVGTLKFIVAPAAKAEPLSGPVGTEVKIQGMGFRTGEDGITITYDNEIIQCNIVGGPDGSWDTTIAIPSSTAGYHKIGIYGSSFTPKGIVPDIQFKVTPKIELQPDSGSKGDRVTVKGAGFASNEKITINFDSIVLDTVTADSLGCFEFAFHVPQSHKGEYTVTASGGSGNTSKVSFIVDKAAPLPPKLLYPKDKDKVEIFDSTGKLVSSTGAFLAYAMTFWNKSSNHGFVIPGVNLSWASAVEDENVTYTLQISRGWENNFVTPILVEKHLTETNYKCNLPPGYYTWRVRATDDIGNESPWSEQGQFQTVVFSPRVFAVLIAIPLSVAGLATWLWFSILKTWKTPQNTD